MEKLVLNTILENQSKILTLLGNENHKPMRERFPKDFMEVKRIELVMNHLKLTAEKHSYKGKYVEFKGFPCHTKHFLIYREMKLSHVDRLMNRYAFLDRHSKSLERLRFIVEFYEKFGSQKILEEQALSLPMFNCLLTSLVEKFGDYKDDLDEPFFDYRDIQLNEEKAEKIAEKLDKIEKKMIENGELDPNQEF